MNHLIVSGLNYHSCPLHIRERFTIPTSCLKHALRSLAGMPHIKEAAVLSTCNRTEVYAVVSDVQAGLHEIESFFLATQSVADHEVLRPDFRLLREDVVLHLFRVASGLDSMVLGEGQILSQVKDAHQSALEAETAGPMIDQLFKHAIVCGKRVRSETSMGRRAVSVSSAAIELARTMLGPLGKSNILIIGAGRMGRVCLKHLLSDAGTGQITIVNRSEERLSQLLENDFPNQERLKTGFDFNQIHELAAKADLIFVSTSAPEYLLVADKLKELKSDRDLFVIDISVPRNVDPAIADLPGVRLFHADDLSAIVNRNLAERESLVSEADNIVFESLDDFHAWERSLLVAPTITELRQKIEAIRVAHMEKSQTSSNSCTDENMHERLEEISRAIINQILHHPTVQLKATRDYQVLRQQAESLRTLFSLNTQAPPSTGPAQSAPAGCPRGQSATESDAVKHKQAEGCTFTGITNDSLVQI